MPRYDYRCEAGHKYERQEPFRSPSEHACERCGKPARRLISTPTVVFKAGGFYKTSNRSDSSTPSGASGSRSKSPASTPAPSADSPSTSHAATDRLEG